MDTFSPEVLVIGPGGARAYLELGALCAISPLLVGVKKYVGCSVGALLCLLLVCGYSPRDLALDATGTKFFHDLPTVNLSLSSQGILPNKTIRDHLIHRVRTKYGFIPTLQQLYLATGYYLVVVTTNLSTGKVEYISKDSDPDLSCIEAVMLSIALPIITGTQTYRGNLYADGAFGNPYPVDLFDDGKTPILGLYIDDIYKQELSPPLAIYRMVHSPIAHLKERIANSRSPQCKHIFFRCQYQDIVGVTLSDKIIGELFVEGYQEGEKFLSGLSNSPKSSPTA